MTGENISRTGGKTFIFYASPASESIASAVVTVYDATTAAQLYRTTVRANGTAQDGGAWIRKSGGLAYHYLMHVVGSVALVPHTTSGQRVIIGLSLTASGGGTTSEIRVTKTVYDPPTLTITSPIAGEVVNALPLGITWDATDATGISYQHVSVVQGGETVWNIEPSSDVRAALISAADNIIENDAAYRIELSALNGAGIGNVVQVSFTTHWAAPAVPTATVTTDPTDLSVSVTAFGNVTYDLGEGETLSVREGGTLTSLAVLGKSVQDGTPSPSAPVTIWSLHSKNLLDDSNVYQMAAGGTGIVSSTSYRSVWCEIPPANSTRTFSFVRNTVEGNRFRVFGTKTKPADGVVLYNLFTTDDAALTGTFSVDATYKFIFIYLSNAGATISAGNIAIYEGADAPSTVIPYGTISVKTKNAANATTRTTIDLQGHALRSLPDGTHDELTVDADGNVSMVQRVGEVDGGSLNWSKSGSRFYVSIADAENDFANDRSTNILSDAYLAQDAEWNAISDGRMVMHVGVEQTRVTAISVYSSSKSSMTAAEFKTDASGTKFVYPLAEPQTISLGTVDLPYADAGSTVSVDAAVTPTISGTVKTMEYEGQPETDHLVVARVNADGTRWVIADDVEPGESVTDPLPPLGVEYSYAITAVTEAGTTSVATVAHVVESTAWALNFGANASEVITGRFNPKTSWSIEQGGAAYHFADGGMGNGLPVWYSTTDRDMSGSVSWDVVGKEQVNRINALSLRYPVGWLRDPFGNRWRAHIVPKFSRNHNLGRVWQVSIDWDAVRFEEAW